MPRPAYWVNVSASTIVITVSRCMNARRLGMSSATIVVADPAANSPRASISTACGVVRSLRAPAKNHSRSCSTGPPAVASKVGDSLLAREVPADFSNGVSALHGEVAREMWASLWPDRAPADVPIGHVTNGVHPGTWLAPELGHALRWAGVRPEAPPAGQRWERARELDLEELWLLRADYRRRLVAEVARRTGRELDPAALTIGFARRFAT